MVLRIKRRSSPRMAYIILDVPSLHPCAWLFYIISRDPSSGPSACGPYPLCYPACPLKHVIHYASRDIYQSWLRKHLLDPELIQIENYPNPHRPDPSFPWSFKFIIIKEKHLRSITLAILRIPCSRCVNDRLWKWWVCFSWNSCLTQDSLTLSSGDAISLWSVTVSGSDLPSSGKKTSNKVFPMVEKSGGTLSWRRLKECLCALGRKGNVRGYN